MRLLENLKFSMAPACGSHVLIGQPWAGGFIRCRFVSKKFFSKNMLELALSCQSGTISLISLLCDVSNH